MQDSFKISALRVLFPGRFCRSEKLSPGFSFPPSDVLRDEMLAKFHAILGTPSAEAVGELALMAGEAMFAKTSSEAERTREEEGIKNLLTNGYSSLPDPVDIRIKYRRSHEECPAALLLLAEMLTYSPSQRISSSSALRHDFLNPDHRADITVDSLVGDDGHERAKRAAVKLKQLDIEGLCHDRKTRRQSIAQLLRTESELIKYPETPRERRGHGHRRTPSGASNDGTMDT